MDQSRGLEKDISGSKKRAAQNLDHSKRFQQELHLTFTVMVYSYGRNHGHNEVQVDYLPKMGGVGVGLRNSSFKYLFLKAKILLNTFAQSQMHRNRSRSQDTPQNRFKHRCKFEGCGWVSQP